MVTALIYILTTKNHPKNPRWNKRYQETKTAPLTLISGGGQFEGIPPSDLSGGRHCWL